VVMLLWFLPAATVARNGGKANRTGAGVRR
jgi:hypothetical protein